MRGRFRDIVLVAIVAGLGLAGSACGPQATEPVPSAPSREVMPLRLGLIPEQDVFEQLERYEPLAEYLSRRTGSPIELKVLTRYGKTLSEFAENRLDGAFFGSFAYVLARARYELQPVARPVQWDGRSTYFGVILVRKDSGIRTAKDLRGKRFAFVDRATTAGYLLPLQFFRDQGIADYRGFLRDYYYAGTHEDAVLDVLEGRTDAAAAKSTVIQRLGARDPRIPHELVPIARSPEVPENALCLRTSVDPALRDAILAALLGMADDAEGREVLRQFGARGFVATSDQDYEPVYAYIRYLGIDPGGFDFESER